MNSDLSILTYTPVYKSAELSYINWLQIYSISNFKNVPVFHLIIIYTCFGNEDFTTGAINRTGEIYDFFNVITTIILEIVEYMNYWIKAILLSRRLGDGIIKVVDV